MTRSLQYYALATLRLPTVRAACIQPTALIVLCVIIPGARALAPPPPVIGIRSVQRCAVSKSPSPN